MISHGQAFVIATYQAFQGLRAWLLTRSLTYAIIAFLLWMVALIYQVRLPKVTEF